MRYSTRTLPALAAGLAALGLVAVSGAPAHAGVADVEGTAGAQPILGQPEAPRPAFYEPPADIPGTPGQIIRSADAPLLLDPLKLSASTVSATRVMYASTDRLGRPIAVTGTIFVPKTAWTGPGKRPVISYAAGTQGMADRCAPSRQMGEGFEYEGVFAAGLIAAGYALAMTDYQGLGTDGSHTYMNREVQGRAVLDMARAAKSIPGAGLADSPVGITGYSQGGGAAAAAAELTSTYAPDLDVKGVVAGAVPADLGAVGANLDGSLFAGFLGYALIGLAAGYDIDMTPYLSEAGTTTLKGIENTCVLEVTKYGGTKSSTLTADGRPLTAYFDEEPFKSVLADNKIGNRKPVPPVLVTHSLADDVIPYSVGRAMATSWCEKGANVRFRPIVTPTHIGGALPTSTDALLFFKARFAGVKQLSNCWALS